MEDYILEMKHISKDYGGIHALRDVDFSLKKGEVLCLCGENGAGKSTLMKILTGVEKPSKGDIFLHGKLAHINKPIDAYRQGISIVHQELVQIPDMTIAENIFVGRYDKKACFIDYRALTEKTNQLMDRLGIHYNPDAKIRQYSVAQRQLIEIMKALSYDSSIIVLDEPTAALTLDETKILYSIIRKLKTEGVSIIFISHRMEDIYAVGDRIYVLKDGSYSGAANVSDVSVEDIIKMMIGRDIGQQFVQKTNKVGEVILEVKGLTNESIKDISFQVRAGEVVGFGGLIGAGRTELLQAIYGVDSYDGEIYYKGELIKNSSPKAAIDRGFSMVPEDRKDEGLILSHSVQNNIQMTILDRITRLGVLCGRKGKKTVGTFIENLNIKTSGIQQKVGMLSGGNQQKVVLAKCMAPEPKVILLDEPTRGVDVGAKAEIYKIINDLASKGFAVIMVSSELPELIAVSDRIIVMREGRISGEIDAKNVTEEQVMTLAI
ncbi:sugar ABC transporter ATP-binding protein [Lachnoclostridium pacaense]|uniref:sugar ABC transporter ATP-binding protein n=1 Tax=Enterocloster hominis (ex Hitch et al. 2024) TaxID=1917870 RepID=UPI001D10FE31|nr:sugar ABC transporter ATP-binding protein [Lachnoclostridium pacaense]MCC2818197.1 sugar ABC transporter ATP-binding protein [Lachnoclostridium pacaense]